MRILYVAFFLLIGFTTQAQNIASLKYGSTLSINNVDIEFFEVTEDSRCPANVHCVQAGKAVVIVNIYIEGNFVEERTLAFHPSGFNNNSSIMLYNLNGLQITGLNLMPYPTAESKTLKNDYYLEFVIDN